jgi:hypothetical protein
MRSTTSWLSLRVHDTERASSSLLTTLPDVRRAGKAPYGLW